MTTELARLNTTAAIRIQVLHCTTESAATLAPVMSLLAFSTSSSTRALKPQEACCIGGQIKLALAQFWNAFGSADERTQLRYQIDHWLLQLGIKFQGQVFQFA